MKALLKQAWAFYEALWPRRTIEQDLLQRAQKAHTVIQQTRHTILSQRFLEHLALAEIAALEHWHHEVYPALLNEFTKGDTK